MKNDLDAFDQRFIALCELHGKEPSPFFCDLYRETILGSLNMDEACRGLELCFKSKTYGFPKPHDVVGMVRGDCQDSALLAWEQTFNAIKSIGPYRSVMFSDSKITRVIEALGGWLAVNQWNESETQYRRNEFMKMYESIRDGGDVKSLPGLTEIDNFSRGYIDRIPGPVMIGRGQERKQIEHDHD